MLSQPEPQPYSDISPLDEPEPWREAFDEQATLALRLRAERYARKMVMSDRDESYARDLVQGVLADTFAGVLTWDPARESLLEHVCGEVRSRWRHDRARAERHVSLHAHLRVPTSMASGEDEPVDDAETAATMAVGIPDDVRVEMGRREERQRGARLGEALARRVKDDPSAAAILSCLRAGVTARADVQAATGLSKNACHNGIRRLKRLARRLTGNHDAIDEGAPQ